MMREKIFRLHRHKSLSPSPSSSSSYAGADGVSGRKFDFSFSNIQAIQVPKGWDRLSLSLVSPDSGKTVRKSGKILVKNGTCRWTENLSESIWISEVNGAKEQEEYLIKFLVATGSSKSSILGETTINLAAFLSSETPSVVSVPLKKCNYGTILQVEVRCLTPKVNPREEKWREMQAHKDENVEYGMENQSEASCTISKSMESRPGELGSRETSFSASVSRYSFESMDGSIGTQSVSSQSEMNGGTSVVFGRQDSIESIDSATVRYQGNTYREEFRKLSHANTAPISLQQNNGSSKMLNDPTIQVLEAEARIWEQNARKLAVDLENLRKEVPDQKLTEEIERLKSLMEETTLQQNVDKKELEDELRFQKEENESLSLQLKKAQESNIELLSILHETEDTIGKQKLEQDLKNQILKDCVAECNTRLSGKEEKIRNLEVALSKALNDDKFKEIENFKEKIQELEADCNELTEENLQLLYELKELRQNDDSLKKETEIKASSYCTIENIERDSSITSDCLSSICSNLLEDKADDMRLMEFESSQMEWKKHLSDLEEENIYLSQRVSGLEAQLRYLAEKSESARLETQQSEFQVIHYQSKVRKLENEVELQKQKLLGKQKLLSETEDERLSLSKLNIKLQATTESLVEEYNLLEKYNAELREQKLKLQNRLEAEERNFQDFSCSCAENIVESGSKCQFIINEVKSKLRVSEEENYRLHMQLQRVAELQNEVLDLRVSVKELKFHNQLLEASRKSALEDYEETKRENISLVEKVSCLEEALLELEDCMRKKNALEEKILRLEGDLIAKDALSVQDSEMKNEHNQMKIANNQLLVKVKHLEDEREDLQKRVVFLEVEMKQRNKKVQDNQGIIVPYQIQEVESTETAESAKAELLEGELQEIRERYFQISLKYAQVEAEREQLVMKLKAFNS